VRKGTVVGHQQVSRRVLLGACGGTALLFSTSLLAACGSAGQAAVSSSGSTVAASGSVAASTTAAATSSAAAATSNTAATSSKAAASSAATSSAATSSAAAAGTGPKATATPPQGESNKNASKSLELWYGWGQVATWQALAKQMGTQLSQYNVQWKSANNNTGLLAVVAAGTPPDVAVGNAPYPEMWAKGIANDLDSYIAKSKEINKTDIPPASWGYASYKGKTYGIPALEAFVRFGLVMDNTILQPKGIDPKTISWDFDTLIQLQQQLTTKNGAADQVVAFDPLDAMGGGFGGGNPFYFGQAWGIKYFDEGTGKFNFDNAELADAMTTVKKLYDVVGGRPAVQAAFKGHGYWTGAQSDIVSGVEIMQTNGYWSPGELAHNAPSRDFAYTWPPVPAAKKGLKFQSSGGHSAFIPNGSKNVGDAFTLIEFLVSEPAEQTIFDGTGWLGARTSFLSKVDVSKYKGLDFYVNSATKNDQLNSMPSCPIEGDCGTMWGKALDDVLAGKQQPQNALQQLQQQVTTLFAQRFPNG
jgi:ABC-type glycerol-3-phosphate transport system substrate-binding protein